MKRCHCYITVIATALTAAACSDTPAGPATAPCTPDTGTVIATVTSGQSVVFDWEPRCAVAMLLIEDDASDVWGISTDEATWDSPDEANRITPPVTYGVAPTGIAVFQEAEQLVDNVIYDLILFRILPEGSAAQCDLRLESFCRLVVHQFTR